MYHADAKFAWGAKPLSGLYERIFKEANVNFASYGIKTIHLTVAGFPTWGNENFTYPGLDPAHVVANREECFRRFLRDAPDDEYWFTEPDCRIVKQFQGLGEFDAVFLYRQKDDVPMCPAWRLANKKALPIFEEINEIFESEPRKDWHGDSDVFTQMWTRMGKPMTETVYNGIRVQMRPYAHYIKGGKDAAFTVNYLGPSGKKKWA